jgi:hypothetical protein
MTMESYERDIRIKEIQDKEYNRILEEFEDEIKHDIEFVSFLIKHMKNKADDFYGFDFTQELQEMLKDLI